MILAQILTQLGLSPEEADIYLSLLSHGPQTASGLGKTTKVQRTYVYRVCQTLIAKGLATQAKKPHGTTFAPLSPDHLLTVAEDQKSKALQAQTSLDGILPSLKDKYRTIDEKPTIMTYEGIAGIKKVYKDILDENTDILLFRSMYDEKFPELGVIVEEHVTNQAKKGIHTRTITPLETDTKKTYLHEDEKRLVTRHIVKNPLFKLPAQILVYGKKVAIISLQSSIITTIIDNNDIHKTFTQLFELQWMLTQQEHESIIDTWKN